MIKPQLLTTTTVEEASKLIVDDRFWIQQKYDGKRVLLNCGKSLVGLSRNGNFVKLPECIKRDMARIAAKFDGGAILDGEIIGNQVFVFDVIGVGPYEARMKWLRENLSGDSLVLVYTATTTEEKIALVSSLINVKAEGVVIKNKNTEYCFGRSPLNFKLKFYKTVSLVVVGYDPDGKRSVIAAVYSEGELGGDCSKIYTSRIGVPVNIEIPKLGSVIEVRFLTTTEDFKLIQPVLLGVRDDISISDCKTSQIRG